MHAYAGDTSSSGEKAETDKQVNDFSNHQAWNVPCFIGEFNSHGTQSAWQYSILQYDQNNMSWANWAYKAIAGSVGNSWGIYDPTGTWPPKPNIQSDSIGTISNDWSQWKTATAFGITPFLKQYLGAPIAVADFYTNSGTLTVSSNSGVLINDQDINLGLAGHQPLGGFGRQSRKRSTDSQLRWFIHLYPGRGVQRNRHVSIPGF